MTSPCPSHTCTHAHNNEERAVERGQWREGEILTQTGGLMMNKKERSAHKGGQGTGRARGWRKQRQREQERKKEREREALFYPTRMDEVVLQVRPPWVRDL